MGRVERKVNSAKEKKTKSSANKVKKRGGGKGYNSIGFCWIR